MRRFLIVLSIVLIIFAGGTFILWRQLPQLVSYLISQETRTHVHINTIRFGFNDIIFDTIIIDSPEKASLKKALKVENLHIKAPFSAYVESPTVIPEVFLKNIYLGIEFYDSSRKKGNWVTIMQNMEGEKKEQSEEKNDDSYQVIKMLKMDNLNIELKLHNQSPVTLSPIPEVKFTDVRTDDGKITKELTQIILKKMMYSVFIMKGIQTVINLPKDVIDTVIMPFKWFSGGSNKNETEAPPESSKQKGSQ